MEKISYDITSVFKGGLKLIGAILSFCLAYILIRSTLKTVMLDMFKLQPSKEVIHTLEPYTFVVLMIIFLGLIYLPPIFQRRTKIYNEVDVELYKEEEEKLRSSLDKMVIDTKQPFKPFFEIADKHTKTVYALTGNWRSGKTTLAGQIVKLLDKRDDFINGGEYYHDTFNFGNINESINAFFSNLASLTRISEFNQLGYAATPKEDLNFTLGSVKLSRLFSPDKDLGYLRKRVQDKLIKPKKTYVVVIDDIDRLSATDQLQWLRTIELLGKFRGTLLLVVPVNLKEVEETAKKNGISKRYLEKILPNTINLGVNINYIKRRFGIAGDEDISQSLARKYAKYMYCLALRICIDKLTNDSLLTKTIWFNDFAGGSISKIALKFHDTLSSSRRSDTTLVLGLNSNYRIGSGKTLVFNDRSQYYRHNIIQLATNCFTSQSEDTNDFNTVRQRTLDWVLNIHTLQNIFEMVRFKEIDSVMLHGGNTIPYNADDESWINFWSDIGYSAVQPLEDDPTLAQYFTYDILSNEIDMLLAIDDESEEAAFFIELTRNGKLAN